MNKTKVHIASSRPEIGDRCRGYFDLLITGHPFQNFEHCDDPEDCDIFISILYDTLVTGEFLKNRMTAVNFHPGILPDYRGAGAYSWALINNEKETGVTLHKMDLNIDSGPILEIRKTPIYSSDTAETLFNRCMDILYDMFCKNIKSILFHAGEGTPNNGGKIYFRKDLEAAKDITNIVKAFTFKGKENCYYYNANNQKIYIDYFGE